MYFVVIAGLALAAFAVDQDVRPAGMLAAGLGTAAMTVVPAAAASGFMLFLGAKRRRAPGGFQGGTWERLSSLYTRGVRAAEILTVADYAVSLHVFGWAGVPAGLGIGRWELPAGGILVAPFLASLLLAWIPLHYAEMNLQSSGPTLGQQLSFNVRQYILTLVVPVGLIPAVIDGMALLPERFRGPLGNEVVRSAAAAAALACGFAVAPFVLVRLWKTSRLPECSLRERLCELCRRVGVRFRDIRIWETPGLYFLNAAVMGVVGAARYIVVSRTLVEVMAQEQVEAVFAHELGHARHRHLVYYLVFAADFVLLGNLFDTLTGASQLWPATSFAIVATAGFAIYWGVGFGHVSKIFERDADLFGAEAVGDTPLYVLALETLAHLNGVSPTARSWRHGSIASRVRLLHAAAENADVRQRFLARVRFLKVFLVVTAAAALAANVVVAFMA